MSELTNSETCGRCGHAKSEHVAVSPAKGELNVFICPTALFLKDELQTLIEDEKP